MKKIVYIIALLVSFNLNSVSFAQSTGVTVKPDKYGATPENYGFVQKPVAKSYISQTYDELYRGVTGSKIPLTAYQEHILNKKLRTRLTKREYQVWVKKKYAKQRLTFIEQLIYLRAESKIKRRQRLEHKIYLDTTKTIRAKTIQQLTPAEKKVLKKAQDSVFQLTPEEKKILKRAKLKLKKIQREKDKYMLTQQDSLLLQKARNDTVKLTLKEKFELYKIHRKEKRIERKKLEKAAAQGDWTPVKVSKTRRLLMSIPLLTPSKYRPSSYVRKLNRYKRRYKLTEDEIQAKNLVKADSVSRRVVRLARRAEIKQILYKQKVYRLKEKYFLKLQTPEVRRKLKKQFRQERAKERHRMWQLRMKVFKSKFRDLF